MQKFSGYLAPGLKIKTTTKAQVSKKTTKLKNCCFLAFLVLHLSILKKLNVTFWGIW